MEFAGINYVAVLAASVAAFVVGSIYYGSLAKPWMKASGISEDEANMSASLFIITFLCEVVLAIMLAGVIGHLGDGQVTIGNGLISGFFIWLGFILTTMIVNHRYGGRGWDLTLIDGGHWLLVVLVMGAVIGYFET